MFLRSAAVILMMLIAGIGLTSIAAAQGDESATLTVHWRHCQEEPADGDWYGACHDDPSALIDAGLPVTTYENDPQENSTQLLDASSNTVFDLPPGTYSVGGGAGEFMRATYVFCASTDTPGVDIGHPVALAAGDDVVCDFYYVSENYSALPPTEPAPTSESSATSAPEAPGGGEVTTSSDAPQPTVTEQPSVPETGFMARLYVGACDAAVWTDPIDELNAVAVPSGDPVGAADAVQVAVSSSTIGGSLNDLLATGHVLVVFDDEESDTAVACGSLGGQQEDNGALAIGLREIDDSGITGVAYLAPGETPETVTNVSMFLLDNLSDDVATPAAE